MKTIGLLGGMSWESTLGYYRAINEGIKKKLGGLHSAKIAMYSVDFDPIEKLQHASDWEGTAKILSKAAQRIQAAGADFLLICTNTMHKVATEIETAVEIPLLHIADATAKILVSEGIKSVLQLHKIQSRDRGCKTVSDGYPCLIPESQNGSTSKHHRDKAATAVESL